MAQMCRVIVIAVLMDAAVIEKWGGLNGGIEVWVHDDRGNDRTNNMPRNTKTKLGIVQN